MSDRDHVLADGAYERRNEDGTLDEFFAQGASIHVEQMNDSTWWMGVTLKDGTRIHLTFFAKRAHVKSDVTIVEKPADAVPDQK